MISFKHELTLSLCQVPEMRWIRPCQQYHSVILLWTSVDVVSDGQR